MSFRITLDRSVFHGENFNRLASSSLEKACRSRKIAIYHTPILIEETLNLWLKPEKRDELKEHLCFLIAIGNGRIFKDRGEIWSGELEGKSEREYLFLSKTDQENKIAFLNRFAKKEENVEDLVKEVLPIKANNREKASNLRKIFIGKRNETAQSRKLSRNLPKSSLSFESYYDLNCDALGAGVIRSHVKTNRSSEELIQKWTRDKSRYPYFTLWIKAFLYANFYARYNSNDPIDWNTQMDISLIVMAKNLDAVISNDLAFMQSAFDALYGTGKEYLTLEDFLKRLS